MRIKEVVILLILSSVLAYAAGDCPPAAVDHGVRICGGCYECGYTDFVCPEDFFGAADPPCIAIDCDCDFCVGSGDSNVTGTIRDMDTNLPINPVNFYFVTGLFFCKYNCLI